MDLVERRSSLVSQRLWEAHRDAAMSGAGSDMMVVGTPAPHPDARQIPVNGVDDPDSRVHPFDIALSDLRGVWRIAHGTSRMLFRRREESRRCTFEQVTTEQLLRFAGVGAISMSMYLLLFAAGLPFTGLFAANAIALAICNVGNTAMHRELAGDLRGRAYRGRFARMTAGLYLVSLVLTTMSLVLARHVDPHSLVLTLLAVTAANAVASVLRFSALRAWVFRPRPAV
jgi:hypothetical protein